MYKERYNYHPPKKDDNQTKIDEICGLSPNYEEYFSYNKYSRSSSNEDKIIYELFFKNGEAKGYAPPSRNIAQSDTTKIQISPFPY